MEVGVLAIGEAHPNGADAEHEARWIEALTGRRTEPGGVRAHGPSIIPDV
jgi:hypothetical protein